MTKPSSSPAAPHRGSLLVIFLTVFIDLLGFGIVLPLLPIYGKQFASHYDWSIATTGWVIGLLMSSFSAMQFFFLPIWGRLSDRFGRRPILIMGLAGSTFFYGLFGFATVWRSLFWLFVSRIGAGIAGATISTAQAYIADTTSKENRAKGMAMIGAAFALGFTLGPTIGVVALFAGGEMDVSPWPGYVASGLSGVALALAVFLLPESRTAHEHEVKHRWVDRSALRAALSTPSIGWLLLTSFIAVFSFANFESTLSLQIEKIVLSYGDGTPSSLLGRIVTWAQANGYNDPAEIKLIVVLAVFSYLGITLTLAQGFLVRRLATRLSEGTMAIAGAVAAIVGFLWLANAAATNDFNALLGAMAVEVIGFAFVNPSLQSLISRRSSPLQQGSILGLGQSATSLARICGPVFGIRLFARSAAWPYWAAAVLMVLATVLIAIAWRSGHDYAGDGA